MKRLKTAYYGVLGALVALGLATVGYRLVAGMKVTAMTSYVSWGFWVALYIYFIGLSAGSFLLSTMVYVFGMHSLEKVGRAALLSALGALAAGLLFVWVDLGHPYRFWEIFSRPHFTSVMAIESWLYLIYMVLILAELWLLLRDDLVVVARSSRRIAAGLCRVLALGYRPPEDPRQLARTRTREKLWVRILGSIGIPVAIGVHGGTGAIFAVAVARPYWNSGLFPVVFLVSALASGAALVTFLYAAFGKRDGDFLPILRSVAMLTVLFIGLDLLLLVSEVVVGLYSGVPSDVNVFQAMFTGRYWGVFWLGQIGLAGIVPIVIVAAAERRREPAPAQAGGARPVARRVRQTAMWLAGLVALFVIADVWLLAEPVGRAGILAALQVPTRHHAGWWYWIGELVIVIAAAAWLARSWGSPRLWYGAAGLATVAGILAVRLNIVIPGFVVPELSGLRTAYVDPGDFRFSYHYFPSFWELATSVGMIALIVLVFSLLWEWLPLFGSEPARTASPSQG